MADLPPCTIEQNTFRGWTALTLRNGWVTLVATPDIGGRIMALNLSDYPYLFVDPDLAGKLFSPEDNQGDGSLAAWKNYGGSKTWPSPQGWDNDEQWHGPPDPLLDSGRYQLTEMHTSPSVATIQMVSPPDPRSGMQITRRVSLYQGGGRATLDLSFTNISDRPRRWSIWNVTQLRADKTLPGGTLAPETACSVSAPLNPHSKFPGGYWVMFGAADNPQWKTDTENGLVTADYGWEIGKIGSDAIASNQQSGWIAFSNAAQGYGFAERFPVFKHETYPDDGSTVECWTVGKGKVANLDYEHSSIYLMETEVLSPLYTFEPGQTRSFKIEWGVCRTAGRVLDVQPGGCTSQKLAAQPSAQGVRLRGVFGAFDAGQLQLDWLGANGQVIVSSLLAQVEPSLLVQFDQTLPPPGGAAFARLSVLAQVDQTARLLGLARIGE